jgi:TonB-dependent starch-binding outer membrane protein SusC
MEAKKMRWLRKGPAALAGVVALALAALVPGAVGAQQTGTVVGQVITDSGEPLPGTQVSIVGTEIGGLTNQEGRFVIPGVPAGERSLQVQRLGYRTVTQTVNVTPGAVVSVDIVLRVSAVQLDQIVVSGQAGVTARREIGAAVATIDARALETAPVSSVSQMLQSRSPGVTVMSGGGQVGQGSRIVLRGATSASQSIEPVIYIDGVRITSEPGTGVSSNAGTSGLDDINPADIERIEIIRGGVCPLSCVNGR